jgi:hypothetical protein
VTKLPGDKWADALFYISIEATMMAASYKQANDVWRMYSRNRLLKPAAEWIWEMWTTDALMYIRRELDTQHGTINLKNVLMEIQHRPMPLSRSRYLWQATWDNEIESDFKVRKSANRAFEEFGFVVAGPDYDANTYADYIDPVVVARDLARLERVAGRSFDYAQRTVAHRTNPKNHVLKAEEIENSVRVIIDLVCKYYQRLHAKSLSRSEFNRPNGWQKAFSIAWRPTRP